MLFGVVGSRGVVDDHAEIGASLDDKARIFERHRAVNGVPQPLGAVAVVTHVIVAPERGEFRAGPAQLVDKIGDMRDCAGPRGVRPESRDHEARHAVPVVLRGADARIAEDEAQDVALFRRDRAVVRQHGACGFVPGDDVPDRGPHQGRTEFERIEHALQPRRDAFVRLVPHLGRAAEANQEQVLALDIGQHQRSRDAVEHIGRRRTAAALLEPSVPGRADIGALRHLLAAQPRRTPAAPREAERGGIEPGAAVLQIGSQQVLSCRALAHPVSHYTLITSLLYPDNPSAEGRLRQPFGDCSCVYSSLAPPASSAPPSSAT
ncbi:hypothetical protein ACVWWO_009382 [Bradyrhizobium sp. F1.13.1]